MQRSELELPGGQTIRQGQPLAPYTTFGIGGPAECLVVPETLEQFAEALAWSRERGISLTLLGGGSNVLIADEGIPGLTILTRRFKAIHQVSEDTLDCECGCFLPHLSRFAERLGRAGWEFMAAIPGTVGAAVRINAGLGSGGEMADWLIGVEALDRSGSRHEFSKEDLEYGYRHSLLLGRSDLFVVQARLKLGKEDSPEGIEKRTVELLARRKRKAPKNPRNCGSVFRKTEDGIPAGLLIEKAGYKGHRMGRCQVSSEHANWVVNLGGATADEVKALIAEVSRAVEEEHGVRLRREVVYLPEDRKGDS